MEEKKENFFKRAFRDMVNNAKEQHKVDKANFQAVKAESKASFEENRGTNTYRRAKQQSKQVWDDAHMKPAERQAKMQADRQAQLDEANARIAAAKERYEKAKVHKNK